MEYEKLVYKIVRKYCYNKSDFEDLFQEGMVALEKAAKNYKCDSDADFSSYAYFYIKGEILNPGVYELELGKRIIDVVDLSGGFTSNAVTTNVNLSKKIYDEMVIIIPDKGNVCEVIQNFNNSKEEDNTMKQPNDGLVNINTASKEQLLNLTGVGESKADAIIEYRKQNKFESIEDIMNIPGIKESLFNKIKDEITI